MDKSNAWQVSAIVIGILGFFSSIVCGIDANDPVIFIVCGLTIYILCLFIYGIGTLIEQNDIIINILNKQKKK